MLKFLRRYNKIILVVGGSILMVLFLLPSTTNQLASSYQARSVAKIDGGTITAMDLQTAKRELDVVETVQPGMARMLGIDPQNPQHWLLLVREAERLGMVGGTRDAREGVSDEQRLQILHQLQGVSEPSLDLAFANLKGVIRMLNASMTSSLYSSRQAVALGHEILDAATIGAVIVPAEKIAGDIPTPSEEEVGAHFEKYRDVDPATDPMGIGYRRPKAVQIEWMQVDRNAIKTAYTPDPIEVNKHYRQNQAKFGPEFSSVRSAVENDYQQLKLDQLFSRVGDAIKHKLYTSTTGIPLEGTYRTLPPDWALRMPRLADLVTVAEEAVRKEVPGAVSPVLLTTGSNIWRDQRSLSMIGPISESKVKIQNRDIPFASYVLFAKELGGPALAGIQKGIVHGPLSDASGNMFYFRITEARPDGPGELAEVRAKVAQDVKRQRAMDKLRAEADVYKSRAIADGLDSVAQAAGTTVGWNTEVSRQTVRPVGQRYVDPMLNAPEFRDAVLDLAEKLDPKANADEIDPAQRTVAIALPTARGLVVAQIVRWRPMTSEKFRASSEDIRRHAMSSLAEANPFAAFSFERLKSRLNYKSLEEEEPEAPAPTP